MKKLTVCLFFLVWLFLSANPRGMTTAPLDDGGVTSVIQERIFPQAMPQQTTQTRDDWYPASTINFRTILPARQQFGMKYEHATNTMSLYSSQGSLDQTALNAIQRVPDWMEAELTNVLLQLPNDKRTIFAQLILDTQDPYVDEVAFAIANSSVAYLISDFAVPDLFTENAAYIYSIAVDLPYVEIIDHGTSSSDDNYWSTTRYRSKDENGNIVTTEVPRDIYYWYIVHPRITDEIAGFIDPDIVESNSTHNNNIVAPPTGKFWRSFLYTAADPDRPVLADTLNECETLYNRDGTGGDAIRTVQWWINQTMGFTSNNERPHQPVRIYRKHIGRCGEYQDYTAAAARLALIPCTGITSVSTDHVWNEFWDQSWVQWEPVNGYINVPLVYENGWGKVFGSVFETRSDGYFTPVTDRYSEGSATIRIHVVDQNGLPAEGARVILAIFETAPRTDNVGFTDNQGYVEFIVGDNRDFRARAETSWGIYPAIAGTYAALTDNSVAGETYNYEFQIAAEKPQPAFTTIDPPADPVQDWQFTIIYDCPEYYLSGKVTWDDIHSLGVNSIFYKNVASPGSVSAFSVNDDDLIFLQFDLMASIFNDPTPASAGALEFSIPTSSDWYSLLDNSYCTGNAVKVTGSMNSAHFGVQTDDPTVPEAEAGLIVYPNPFRESLKLRLTMQESVTTKISIYNQRGQIVKQLLSGDNPVATQELSWDGCDSSGSACANGIYFLRLESGKTTRTIKLLRVR